MINNIVSSPPQNCGRESEFWKNLLWGGTGSPGSLGGGDFGWEIQNCQISVGGGTRNLTKKNL